METGQPMVKSCLQWCGQMLGDVIFCFHTFLFCFLQLPTTELPFSVDQCFWRQTEFYHLPRSGAPNPAAGVSHLESFQKLCIYHMNMKVLLPPGWLCWKSTLALLLKTVSKIFPESCERLFTRGCSDQTRENGFKLKQGRFRLDIWKKSFTMLLLRHWNIVPGEAVDSPPPESVQGWTGWGSE